MLEQALERDRLIVVAGLGAATLIAWAWIIPMSRDMYGSMSGASAWMTPETWDATHLVLLFAMWSVMMTAMMLPSAAPAILLYTAIVRRSVDASATSRAYLFAAGYLIVWAAFSAVAVFVQRKLTNALILSPMMELSSRRASSAVFALAGIYQLTPFKRSCLSECQSPATFVARHWHNGPAGAMRMGLTHGLYCLGCCWALMLLLFAGGVMHLPTIAMLTVLVLLEKTLPLGQHATTFSWLTGAGLITIAIWRLM